MTKREEKCTSNAMMGLVILLTIMYIVNIAVLIQMWKKLDKNVQMLAVFFTVVGTFTRYPMYLLSLLLIAMSSGMMQESSIQSPVVSVN